MNNLREARNRGCNSYTIIPNEQKIEELRKFLYRLYKFNEFTYNEFRAAYSAVMYEFIQFRICDIFIHLLSSKRIIKIIRDKNRFGDTYKLIPRKNNREEMVEYALTLF